MTNYNINGDCSFEGENVVLTGTMSATATCSGGSYSFSLDYSSEVDGSINITLDHSHPSGLAAIQLNESVLKDSVGPNFTSIDLVTGSQINSAVRSGSPVQIYNNLNAAEYSTDEYALILSSASCNSSYVFSSTLPMTDSNQITSDGIYKLCIKLSDSNGNTNYFDSAATVEVDTVVSITTEAVVDSSLLDGFINATEQGPSTALISSPLVSSEALTIEYTLTNPMDCSLASGWNTTIPTMHSIAGDNIWYLCYKATDAFGNIRYPPTS